MLLGKMPLGSLDLSYYRQRTYNQILNIKFILTCPALVFYIFIFVCCLLLKVSRAIKKTDRHTDMVSEWEGYSNDRPTLLHVSCIDLPRPSCSLCLPPQKLMGHFLQCHTTQQHCLPFAPLGHAQTHKHMCTHNEIKQDSAYLHQINIIRN